MEIYYTFKARDDLENLPRDTQERIAQKMRFYASQKDPIKFAKRLVDSREGEFRFRVGDWGYATRNQNLSELREQCYQQEVA